MKYKIIFTLSLCLSVIALVSCSKEQRIAKMPDYQLKKEVKKCQNISQPTKDEKALCKLYIAECSKRQEMGRHSCNAALNEGLDNRPIKKLREWD